MTACLIVDDEHDIRTLIALSLRREAVTCSSRRRFNPSTGYFG